MQRKNYRRTFTTRLVLHGYRGDIVLLWLNEHFVNMSENMWTHTLPDWIYVNVNATYVNAKISRNILANVLTTVLDLHGFEDTLYFLTITWILLKYADMGDRKWFKYAMDYIWTYLTTGLVLYRCWICMLF